MRRVFALGAALAFAALLFTNPAAAGAAADERGDLLQRAAATMQKAKVDPIFANARSRLDQAKAVIIVPALTRGGFIFGAEGGSGVLLARTPDGMWSDPVFVTLGGASFGLQAGVDSSEVVMLLMSDQSLAAVTRSGFRFGAGAGLTMVTLGASAGAATGDIIIWAASRGGIYGGLTLDGSVINIRDDWNQSFYGRRVDASEILSGRVRSSGPNPVAQQLASQ
ncbi:MAG: lipid-binding SYLF domain-containing protein [Hyphomicrobiaceae bacterium]